MILRALNIVLPFNCKITVFPWNRNVLNQYHKEIDVIAIKEQDNNKKFDSPRICLHNANGPFVLRKLRKTVSAVCLCSLFTKLGGAFKNKKNVF